jgi:hypothetical protein
LLQRKLKAAAMSAMGRQLPCRLLARAAAMSSITDTKADDWGDYRATRRALLRRTAEERAKADIEGHSTAAKFSEPRRLARAPMVDKLP